MAYEFDGETVYVAHYNKWTGTVTFNGDGIKGERPYHELTRSSRYDLLPANLGDDLAESVKRFLDMRNHLKEAIEKKDSKERIMELRCCLDHMEQALRNDYDDYQKKRSQ
jgi:hypothetical protein